ncbi:MAG: alpha/beta fold hydrolase [Solirubrobacterales bacterium]
MRRPVDGTRHPGATVCAWRSRLATLAVALTAVAATSPARAEGPVGTSFPPDFPTIEDHSLGQPVIGFGASGVVERTPAIFLHGNNDTPYPTDCNAAFGKIQEFAQYFHEHGYARSELWGLGYQGDQCDLQQHPTNRSGEAHSTVANVPDLRAFVRAVLDYTGARQVDIVGHSLGATLAREWMRQDNAYHVVRKLVAVDGPSHGIINCSPSPQNYWQQEALGGFTPVSAICREYGSDQTPFLSTLNRGDETPGGTRYLSIYNADTSFVYYPKRDGTIPPVPGEDRNGNPHDFSNSARLHGAENVPLTGQGRYDNALQTAHLGIVNSPEAWQIALEHAGEVGTSQASGERCPGPDDVVVPRAERQESACLDDLTTRGTTQTGHTNQSDWNGLHASGTHNPIGVPGLQIDGYFPDESTSNTNNGFFHDSQFVLRMPDRWNGKLVVTGAPGVRAQYANDFIIGDWVLARGYAFASTDKGNTGTGFYNDGEDPGDAVAEWHRRVRELTLAAKETLRGYYGRAAQRTYITGISNGGYLTRWALEHDPELYDGGVDWEGTLFRPEGPNLFTYLPTALANYPAYLATGDEAAHDRMIDAGFEPGSEFLWDYHYGVYWDLTQRIYREEFDPGYDGPLSAGIPFCQPGTPSCDADYQYEARPDEVKEAVARVSNSGELTRPMLTLHGTLDALLPIRTDSDVYARLVEDAGRAALHRYYTIEAGNHVDGLYDDFPDRLRPILPCQRAAFVALEQWVEDGTPPPPTGSVPKSPSEDVVNSCALPDDRPQGPPPADQAPGDAGAPGGPAGRCERAISGTKGSDRLTGTPGSDRISAKRGHDRLQGRRGDDCLRGGAGRDRISGGSGDDQIRGGRGEDRLRGRAGDDVIRARRGARDRIDCGPGDDVALVNAKRDRTRHCEALRPREPAASTDR